MRAVAVPKVKITPRVGAGVARRLRLAAGMGPRSMSALVHDALDQALPSLEEIRAQLAVVTDEGGSDDRGR